MRKNVRAPGADLGRSRNSSKRFHPAVGIEGSDRTGRVISTVPSRSTQPWESRIPARTHQRDLRAGVFRQDHHPLQVIADAQKKGGMAAFIDVEHALDPIYAGSWSRCR